MDGPNDVPGKGGNGSGRGGPAGRRCPICGRPARHETRPFCSRRCADVDLGRWLGGAYSVPGRPAEEEDADLPPAGDPPSRDDRATE